MWREAKARSSGILRRVPPQAVLLITFASFYFAIGPGNFFSVDEVMEEETAQALILRHTIDIPAMVDARHGRGHSFYTVKGPGLPLVALPFVYLGLKLDDAAGSMNGGQLAGPPIGPDEQPLRWGGRLAASASLIVNAIAGGAIVAMLFMVGAQLSPNRRAAMLMAIAAGLATLVMSEATHFYQHELDALMVLIAFWFFSGRETNAIYRRALFGGISLGIAILARPDSVPATVIIWMYGAVVAWVLLRNFPDRWSRMIRRTIIAMVGPIGAVAGTMYFNYLRFGNVVQFGYTEDRARFVLDIPQIAKGIAGYLVSPSLSIFIFGTPLILALWVGRRAYRRWPLETATLVAAAVAHLLMIAANKTWSGDLSFGPRYMLESIVLLMPLTMPAFEMAVDGASIRATIAVAAVMVVGFLVQLIGVAVNVSVNEWNRIAAGIVNKNEWVFVPSASPIVYQLEEIVARRNLSPWAIRALKIPDAALLLLIILVMIVLFGGRRILDYFRAPHSELANLNSGVLPAAIVAAAVIPLLIGFAMVRPITEAPDVHAYALFNAGMAAQRAGRVVAAEEDYAMVLTLYPSSKYPRYNLGLLEQDAGRINEAIALYEKVLREDPKFAPAKQNMEYILHTRFGFPNPLPP
jgi:Tetratricopeptide repeat